MMDSMYMVLPPKVDSLEELEYWHNKFMQLTYDQRRTSNDISIAQFGYDNITRYNKMRADFFNNIDNNDQIYNKLLSYFRESSTLGILFGQNFTEKMDRVKAAEDQGLVIVVHTDRDEYNYKDPMSVIRTKWEKFNSLSTEQRNLSDQTALNIFGIDNYNLYNKYLNDYLEDLWKKDDYEHANPGQYHSAPHIGERNDINVYYTPEEMGNSKSSSTLVSESGKILDTYKWINELTNLNIQLKYTNDKNKIESIKEQIHNLWWNPEIPFSLEAASKTHFRKGFNILTESANSAVDIYTLAQKML